MIMPITRKKLIEVALPLDDINREAAGEKSIRHGHPSTLHLWWARRPLAAARAVIFAQMVDDPGSLPEEFPTEAAQEAARQRLFQRIRELVKWENTTNERLLEAARAEIRKSWARWCRQSGEDPAKLPPFHDPFAGGGSLPLEAQRLGLEAHASDLNPVAVLINKAMIEIPPRFAAQPPVNPEARSKLDLKGGWHGAAGLADDVRYYGAWMRQQALQRVGHLYLQATLPDGRKATVIAWLWARTVASPNPAFRGCQVPLVSSFWLSTKLGKEAWIEPVVEGKRYRFEVRPDKPTDKAAVDAGTKLGRGANFRCLLSSSPIAPDYIKAEGMAGRMGVRLMAIVAEGDRGRVYLPPTEDMEAIARQAKPTWRPAGEVPSRLTGGTCYGYGLIAWGDLFTPRQLVALTTFSDLVQEAREKVRTDYLGVLASRPHLPTPGAGETPALPGWHSRGYLPHWEAGEMPQSLTFRLHDSLPRALREHWRVELAHLGEAEQQLERRKRLEAALDAGHGACFLQQPDIAALVENALLYFDGERYRLHAWIVMPNHVHVLVTPLHSNSLSSLVHTWKSFTAKAANRLLGREGAFWFEEYFDRAIRDDRHFARVVAYIENNPAQAGLCAQAADWPFGSARLGASLGARPSWALPERAGRPRSQAEDMPLDAGGAGAQAYADAVAVYLGIGVSKLTDYNSSLVLWSPSRDQTKATFTRQALPMVWDFAEVNPLAEAAGDLTISLNGIAKALSDLPSALTGYANQADAAKERKISATKVLSTDPPYYDNIGYADLSDFFYLWLRRSLQRIYPALFSTLVVPKTEELVATPYRHGSREAAETFFLDGMTRAMHSMAQTAHPAFPVTIYYAFKQSERDHNGTASTGWETFLEAVIRSGFSLTGTWPTRTECASRSIGIDTNALASSIVLVCRPRPADAPITSRRDFLTALKREMPSALRHLQQGNIAPVDLAQASIGPGMAIFTRYARILESDGTPMRVRTALTLINQTLNEVLAEQEGDFDADTGWAVAWFEQFGFNDGPFGDAETLCKAKNTAMDGLQEAGIARAGKVRLLRVDELPAAWDPLADRRLTVWESVHHLIRALNQGETAAAALVARLGGRAETARELAYRLYNICERRQRAQEAQAYNGLVQSWPEIVKLARETPQATPEQTDLL
jgi:putative DNA methylase